MWSRSMSEEMSETACLEKLEEMIPDDLLNKAGEEGQYGDGQIIMAAAIYIQNLENQVNDQG